MSIKRLKKRNGAFTGANFETVSPPIEILFNTMVVCLVRSHSPMQQETKSNNVRRNGIMMFVAPNDQADPCDFATIR